MKARMQRRSERMRWLGLMGLLAMALWMMPQLAWCQKPPPLPSAGELNFIDNYGGDETKVVFWWNDGWFPPHWTIVGTANPDPNSNYCVVQPVYNRFIFGYTNGVYSIAPARAIVIDMMDATGDPCIPDLERLYIPRLWHAKLVPN